MPLEQRVIAPIYVSRGCFNLDPGHGSNQISPNIPNELECVTNGTLANIIRQLSTLSRYAEDLFGSLLVDTSALVQRSVSLKSRLDVLSEKVERLDASDSGAVPGQNGAGQTGTISRKPFRSRADNFDQQVVARTTIPLSLREVYEKCDEPPPLDKLNPFRDDNMNGLKLYTNPNYFFELWRKEMLADRSRNKVAKKGDNVHMSGGKSKRTKASILRHQNSINSESQMSNTASPHHPAAATAAAHYHMHHMTSRGSISSNEIPPGYPGNGAGPPGPIYNENGVLVGQPGQPTAAQVYQQQKIYGQVGMGQPQQIYGYAHQDSLVAMKREEPNPSGVGFHTVIEGYSVDPNNYQHHYVQHQYAPGAGPQGQVLGQGQSRPNSLELSHQQQQQQQDGYQNQQQGYAPPPPPPPNQMDYYQQQQQNYAQQQNRGSYPMGQQPIYGTQGQYPSPNGSQMTPTRRAAQLSRPSAPPPAPPGSGPNSAANSAPSTPKKLNGGGDMMVAVSGHPQLVSRDSLPPPPPPPNGGSMMGQHQQMQQQQHHQYPHPHGGHEDSVLPPPPPPPPPPMSGGMMGNTTSMNGAQNDVCSPPPPPPPPMNGLLNSSSTAQFAKSSNNSTSQNGPSTNSNSNGTSGKPTAEMLQAVKLRPTQQNTNGSNGSDHVDARSNLLAAIRHGIKLKRVEESRAREVEKSVPLHDVASILARRVAMELSDSEGEAEEEDADDSDAWDDESEC